MFDLELCSSCYNVIYCPLLDRFGVTRAHLEEDAGKTVYGGADRLAGSEYSLVDYNRAGEIGKGARSLLTPQTVPQHAWET